MKILIVIITMLTLSSCDFGPTLVCVGGVVYAKQQNGILIQHLFYKDNKCVEAAK